MLFTFILQKIPPNDSCYFAENKKPIKSLYSTVYQVITESFLFESEYQPISSKG